MFELDSLNTIFWVPESKDMLCSSPSRKKGRLGLLPSEGGGSTVANILQSEFSGAGELATTSRPRRRPSLEKGHRYEGERTPPL